MNELYNDKEKSKVYYLGQDMKLSKKQYQIWCSIEDGEGKYMSAEQIIDKCYNGKKPQKGDITTHICYINRQARKISNRSLIVSKYGVGYKITEKP